MTEDRKKKVVVIGEDDEPIAVLLRDAISDEPGYQAVVVADGANAEFGRSTSGFVNVMGAIVIGFGAGVLCYLAIQLRERIHVDDALDGPRARASHSRSAWSR